MPANLHKRPHRRRAPATSCGQYYRFFLAFGLGFVFGFAFASFFGFGGFGGAGWICVSSHGRSAARRLVINAAAGGAVLTARYARPDIDCCGPHAPSHTTSAASQAVDSAANAASPESSPGCGE